MTYRDDADLNTAILLDRTLGPDLDVEDLDAIVDGDPDETWPISGDALTLIAHGKPVSRPTDDLT